jgi:hypothetical protein
MTPAYLPRIVVISENKDTAVGFPELPGAIAIEGDGSGAATVAAIGWVRSCPTVIYWGDMDADGLAILDEHRAAGLPAISILMDIATFDAYAEFGTNSDKHGDPILVTGRRDLPTLTAAERDLYERLTDPGWAGYRRIEQERIPLHVARCAVTDAAGG